VNVFLSYAVAPFDTPIAARLRAVAAAYDISILLPDRNQVFQNGLTIDTQTKIGSSDAVIALITTMASSHLVSAVNLELQAAAQSGKPIIALIEQGVQIQAAPGTQIVYFNRFEPAAHEKPLVDALANIRQQQQWKQSLTALGWIAGIALGMIALSELIGDKK
jgi:hypothetical protein